MVDAADPNVTEWERLRVMDYCWIGRDGLRAIALEIVGQLPLK